MENLKRMLLIQHPFFLRLIFRELELIRINPGHPDQNLAGSPPDFQNFTITFCDKSDSATF